MSISSSPRPICSAVGGFLGVTAMAMTFSLANEIGIIDGDLTRRAIGLVIGLMVVVIGNFLPKLRPLHSSRVQASAAAIERLSGWILVLAGSAWIALFALAPLNQARHVAALIGLSAVTFIAVNWVWLSRLVFFGGQSQGAGSPVLGELTAGRRKIVVYLLFAFFFAVVTSCVKFLVNDRQLAEQMTSWMLFAFCMLYAGLFAALELGRARN